MKIKLIISITIISIAIIGCKKKETTTPAPAPIPAPTLPTKSNIMFESNHSSSVEISTDNGVTYNYINNVYQDDCSYVVAQIQAGISSIDRLNSNGQVITYKIRFHWTPIGGTAQLAQGTFQLVDDGNYHLKPQKITDSGDLGTIGMFVCSASVNLIVMNISN